MSEAEVEKIFNALKPIKSSLLIGEWNGGSFDTGHPGQKSLKGIRWAGKDFRSDDDVDPIMVLDEAGKRVYNEEWGHASVSLILCFFSIIFVVCAKTLISAALDSLPFFLLLFRFTRSSPPSPPNSPYRSSKNPEIQSVCNNQLKNKIVATDGVSRGGFYSHDLWHTPHLRPFPLREREYGARRHGLPQSHGYRRHFLLFPHPA